MEHAPDAAGELISFREASRRYPLSRSHLLLLARTGRVRAMRAAGGREWFTTPAAVEAYLADAQLRSHDPFKRRRGQQPE
jgi:hypothetical protein